MEDTIKSTTNGLSLEAALEISEMIDDEIQFTSKKVMPLILIKETKGKKMQVGNPRLHSDYEAASQSGHIITDSECQTDPENVDEEWCNVNLSRSQEHELMMITKEFEEKEIQSEVVQMEENIVIAKSLVGKKVQVGYPRTNDILESACQAGMLVVDMSVQTELEETLTNATKGLSLEAALEISEMIDDETQFTNENILPLILLKETKGKKMQVGNPRLHSDYEAASQSGHIVTNSECQTDPANVDEEWCNVNLSRSQEHELMMITKVFEDKEIQPEGVILEEVASKKRPIGKKIQVGYSLMNNTIETCCQTGILVKETETQTEIEETMMSENKSNNLEAALDVEDLIDDETQYTTDNITRRKEMKGKKLQVGTPRIDGDYEVANQSGRIVSDVESQTEVTGADEVWYKLDLQRYEECPLMNVTKEYEEKEIQPEEDQLEVILTMKAVIGKKVQVGNPQVYDSIESACQVGVLVEHSSSQTNLCEDSMTNRTERSEEAALMVDGMMVDDDVQYDSEYVVDVREKGDLKNKKLQVGRQRLDGEFDVSCQTGRLVIEIECQTDRFDYEDDIIDAAFAGTEQSALEPIEKEFVEKEIQSENILRMTAQIGKKVQVGYPRTNEMIESACQSGVFVQHCAIQTDIEEGLMRMKKTKNEEALLMINEMIQEEIQYEAVNVPANTTGKEVKNKKLQVGSPKLDSELEFSCQTGRIISDIDCQTDYVVDELLNETFAANEEYQMMTKVFAEKESQSEEILSVKSGVGKKVQVGYPRVNQSLESSCQTGSIMAVEGSQTELEETSNKVNRMMSEKCDIMMEDMFDELVQYDCKNIASTIVKNEQKNKKLQVGIPRLDGEFDAECQTGHLIKGENCQTDDGYLIDEVMYETRNEEQEMLQTVKTYSEKEVQSDEILTVTMGIGKKVQVGYSRMNQSIETACQMGLIMNTEASQTDFEEILISAFSSRKEEAFLSADNLVSEAIQYDDGNEVFEVGLKDCKGKKIQVGYPRVDSDSEAASQTGHIVLDSECQTESMDFDEEKINYASVRNEEEALPLSEKQFVEKEIQSENILATKTRTGKKVQVGFSRLTKVVESACQVGVLVVTLGTQTQVDDEMMTMRPTRNEEAAVMNEEMFDEDVQYDREYIVELKNVKERKNKKLQVGHERLDGDFEMSCQTGHIINDIQCQTDNYDFEEGMLDTCIVGLQSSVLSAKVFADREIQSEDIVLFKTGVGKRVQVGYPRLYDTTEIQSQTEIPSKNVTVQTEIREVFFSESKNVLQEAALNIDGMIEEMIQFDNDEMVNFLSKKELKGKKLQVGSARLGYDLEVSCQTGRIIADAFSQTEANDSDEERIFVIQSKEEAQSKMWTEREFEEKEVQSDKPSFHSRCQGKRVQVGYPRLDDMKENECQSEMVWTHKEIQTDQEDELLFITRMVKEEAILDADELIDEKVQYVNRIEMNSQNEKETKGKTLQVGGSRLEIDFEVSCQTGHIIMDVECQTERYNIDDDMINITTVRREEEINRWTPNREFAEKEIQSEEVLQKKSTMRKIVQVGYPRINETVDIECQTKVKTEDSYIQTEIEETFVSERRNIQKEAALNLVEMIDEEIQYGDKIDGVLTKEKEFKGKKLQVGNSRLEVDFEFACQTGHVIADSQCQTDEVYPEEEMINVMNVRKEEELNICEDKKFAEKEVQSNQMMKKRSLKNKSIQIGYPRVCETIDFECQSETVTCPAITQTEIKETMILERRTIKKEFALNMEEMVDEEVQYGDDIDDITINEKETKGKKLQVGNSRLEVDFEVSCQTGHIIEDAHCQTDQYDMDDSIQIINIRKEEELNIWEDKEFAEKEIQSEETLSKRSTSSKKSQVGYPRLLETKEVECEAKESIINTITQTEIEETMIFERKAVQKKATLNLEEMIDEEVQYGNETDVILTKDKYVKGKKLQVGNSRLDVDFEAACQTGHVIADSECQTDRIDMEDTIQIINLRKEEEWNIGIEKEFAEKEIQSDEKIESRPFVSKKVQVGYPRLFETKETECEAKESINDMHTQTEIEETMMLESRLRQENNELNAEEMIDEEIQYGDEIDESLVKKLECKGKKLQVGNSRLDIDFEVACQTGHVIIDFGCQTDPYDEEDEIHIIKLRKEEESNLLEGKQFAEKEVESNEKIQKRHFSSKKVQIGYSRLSETKETECQTKISHYDEYSQTDLFETLVIDSRTVKEEATLDKFEMIDEELQFDEDSIIDLESKKECKDNQLQVGYTKLDYDFEVACQTGHIIGESQCQTDEYDFEDTINVVTLRKEEEVNIWRDKEFDEKEIQSDIIKSNISMEGKKIQVGYSRLFDTKETECQAEVRINSETTQTDTEETMMFAQTTRKEEAVLNVIQMIDEEVQFGDETNTILTKEKEFRGKKIQAGNSKLEIDFEVACQTGHLIKHSQCQTEEETTKEEQKSVTTFREENREYGEKEVQTEDLTPVRSISVKNVQIGYPQVFEFGDIGCQVEVRNCEGNSQTDIEETIVIDSRTHKANAYLSLQEMMDEEVQYSTVSDLPIEAQRNVKGKKLQVGSSRLDGDFEVACQTGHIVVDFECQTDNQYSTEETIDVTLLSGDEVLFEEKEFAEREIQSEDVSSLIESKSIKVQVGYTHLNECQEFGSQTFISMKDGEAQTDVDETLINKTDIMNVKMALINEQMIDEELQFGDKIIQSKETKDKELQIGHSSLKLNFEVFCQTGRLTRNIDCQTEELFPGDEIIDSKMVEIEEEIKIATKKYFGEKEIQSEEFLKLTTSTSVKVQVGHPQISEPSEKGCQSTIEVDNAKSQTEVNETMIIISETVKSEATLLEEYLVDEAIQYGSDVLVAKEFKGKKLQVGNPKLNLDTAVSSQTVIPVSSLGCQTNKDLWQEELLETQLVVEEESAIIVDETVFAEKEVQSEDLLRLRTGKPRKLQVGYPHIDESMDVGCQVKVSCDDDEAQTEVKEKMIVVKQAKKEKVEKMWPEEVQYDDDGDIYSTIDIQCEYGQDHDAMMTDSSIIDDSGFNTLRRRTSDTIKVDQQCQYDIVVSRNMTSTQTDLPKTEQTSQYDLEDVLGWKTTTDAVTQDNLTLKDIKMRSVESQYVIDMSNRDQMTQKGCPFSLVSIDEEVQTSEYAESHSVSLQIGPKVPKFDQPAHLLLNYFNKQVDIIPERGQGNYESVDVEHHSNVILLDRLMQYRADPTVFLNKLTSVGSPSGYIEFCDSFNSQMELVDKLVAYSPRKRTTDQVFEFNGAVGSNLSDIDHIPKFITKDNIRLFESIATQVTEVDIVDDKTHRSKTSLEGHYIDLAPKLIKGGKSTKEMSSVTVMTETMEMINEETEVDKYFRGGHEKGEQVSLEMVDEEVMFVGEIHETIEFSMDHGVCDDDSLDGIVKSSQSKEMAQLESTIEMYSVGMTTDLVIMVNAETDTDGKIKAFEEVMSKKVTHSVNTETISLEMVDEEVMFDGLMRERFEFAVEHDTTLLEGKQQRGQMSQEYLEGDEYQISLGPKLINLPLSMEMNSIFTEVCLVNEPNNVSLFPKCIKCDQAKDAIYDDKTTSTPEMIEKCSSSTQVYVPKTYVGESQTSVSAREYGVQVTDFESLPSTPCLSPIPSNNYSLQTKTKSRTDDNYTDVCVDVNFEEDYVFETIKSRSVVTTKQEILPKLSLDFGDVKEESTHSLSARKHLSNTKTQSVSEYNFDAAIQTDNGDFVTDNKHQYISIYNHMLESRCVKEQAVQGTLAEGLFEILLKDKGAQFIMRKYQKAVDLSSIDCQTENILVNSVKTQYYPENLNSVCIQTMSSRNEREPVQGIVAMMSDRDTTASIISGSSNRPAHRNMRIQRGCSYFKMMDVSTNTDETMGDHIEVTYTETILEESIITKRPRSKIDTLSENDDLNFSRSSTLNRASMSSTPIPITNQSNRQTQTHVVTSAQIFVEQDLCDLFLTFTRTHKVTAVHDYLSGRFVSLTEAIDSNIINLSEDFYKISDSKKTTVENAVKERFIR